MALDLHSNHCVPCSRVIGGDDFIANLWNVHLKVKKDGYVQVSISKTPKLFDLAHIL
jgi:hypothetical protein